MISHHQPPHPLSPAEPHPSTSSRTPQRPISLRINTPTLRTPIIGRPPGSPSLLNQIVPIVEHIGSHLLIRLLWSYISAVLALASRQGIVDSAREDSPEAVAYEVIFPVWDGRPVWVGTVVCAGTASEKHPLTHDVVLLLCMLGAL
jgi:hypothetical protein